MSASNPAGTASRGCGPVSTELQRLSAIFAALAPDDAAWLRSWLQTRALPPWQRRALRHAQRAAAIQEALTAYEGWRPTRAADELASELVRVAACHTAIGERADLLRRIIALSNGRVIGARQIYSIMAGEFEENR